MKENNLSYPLALSVMNALVESGVRFLVTSPGYRNSPLLLAANRHPQLEVISSVDERGAAFLALGLTKNGQPAAVLCTSGTAVANYFPAVMEAYQSHCPLVVLTADRPSELIGTGANQCTDQTKVFGDHVRFYGEISCAEESFPAETHANFTIGRALALCLEPIPGPVHVNIRFREPFLPDAAAIEVIEKNWQPKKPWKFLPSSSGPGKEQWQTIEAVFKAAQRPLLLLGPSGFSAAQLESLQRLSAQTGYPILAESASGLPFRGGTAGYISRHLETTLGAINAGKLEAPDLIVRLGAPLTGKGLGKLLQSGAAPQIIFDHWGESREPHLHPSIFIQGGMDGWISAILRSDLALTDTVWRKSLLDFGKSVETRLENHLEKSAFTEWFFHRELGHKMSDGAAIFLGNSMPIRDFNDAFSGQKLLHVFCNRGLSGIDGLIASAAGVALETGREMHLVLGDLSTLHDISSLSLLSSLRDKIKFTLWTMNNGGGEIFRVVPTNRTAGNIDWFTTPQVYDLASLAKAFRLPFSRVVSREDFAALEPEAFSSSGVRVVEVLVDKETNLATRQSFRPLG